MTPPISSVAACWRSASSAPSLRASGRPEWHVLSSQRRSRRRWSPRSRWPQEWVTRQVRRWRSLPSMPCSQCSGSHRLRCFGKRRGKNSRRQGAVAQLSSLFRRSLIVFATATSSQAGSLSLKTLHASPLAASGAPGRRTISPSDCAKMLTMDESWRGKGCATSEPSASSVRRARI